MIEEWRAVPWARGYEVSNLGRARSLDRLVRTSNRQFRRYSGMILKPQLNNQGYPRVWIIPKAGDRHHEFVHCLVAEAFLGPRPKGMEVAHKDGTRTNCRLSNLRYDTPKGNAADKKKHGTLMEKESHPGAVLNERDIIEIRDMLANGQRQWVIAEAFGVSRTNISAIATGRSWK